MEGLKKTLASIPMNTYLIISMSWDTIPQSHIFMYQNGNIVF